MLRVLLVRPGATEFDRQGRIRGNLDIPLCDEGRQQIVAMSRQLNAGDLVAVYSSTSQASQETAALIAAASGIKPKIMEGLANLDHGLWQGLLLDEVRAKQPKVYRRWQETPEAVCPPQGETVAEGRQRVEEVLRKLVRKHKTGTVALVVSNPLASILRNVIVGGKLADTWQACNQAGWEQLEWPQAVAPSK